MNRFLNILFLLSTTINFAHAVDYKYNQQQSCIDVLWKVDDMCGILTTSGTQIIHWVTDGDSYRCTLSSYGWNLAPYSQYYAYYPLYQSYNPDKTPITTIPISYTEQSQSKNGNIDHLRAYDYMTARTVSSDEACHFSFKHIGSILRLECALQGSQTLQTLTLSSKDKHFVTAGTMDVTTDVMTPTEYSETAILDLNNMQIENGENLVAYVMLPPMNLTDAMLYVTITTADGYSSTAEMKGTMVRSGYLYPVELEMPEFTLNENVYKKNNTRISSLKKNKAKAPETTIDSPTAYIPSFETDFEYMFMQKVEETPSIGEEEEEESPATVIVSKCLYNRDTSAKYSINGLRMQTAKNKVFFINNGKKYIEVGR